MRASSVRVMSIVSLSALSFAAVAWSRPVATDEDSPGRAAEVHRIRLHFDSVLTELGDASTAGLTAAQTTRRSALMATLEGYRDRGVFPHNYDFPGRAVPYFVDRETGTLCAVGYLLASTGRRDIVDRVAQLNNNVYVADLAGDTAFTAWLGENGLTLSEAARIQVPYMGEPIDVASTRSSNGIATAYKVGSAVTIGGALFTTVWNARANRDGRSGLANVLGVTAGVAALGLGVTRVGYQDAPPALAIANVIAGAGSAWVSTRGILRHHRSVAATREATRRESAEVSVSPIVVPSSAGTGAGVSVSLRF